MKKNPDGNNTRWVILAVLVGFIIIAYLGYRSRPGKGGCLEGLIEAGNTTEITSILIKDGRTANTKCKHGRTPLHFAVFFSKADIIKLLIEKGADVNAKDNNKFTPLYYAMDADTAELLIKSGAQVNAGDGTGYTPLHHAVSKQNTAVVKTLIANGADARIENAAGTTAGRLAESSGYTDIADAIRRERQKEPNDKEIKPGL
jgi:ankyrin repeat protein